MAEDPGSPSFPSAWPEPTLEEIQSGMGLAFPLRWRKRLALTAQQLRLRWQSSLSAENDRERVTSGKHPSVILTAPVQGSLTRGRSSKQWIIFLLPQIAPRLGVCWGCLWGALD